jgi:hypothetical protein
VRRQQPRYDLVLASEDGAVPGGVGCAPILIRDSDELLGREEARASLGATSEPLVVVVESRADRSRLSRLAAEAEVVAVRSSHFPLLELCNGIDGIIGCPGYSLWHEAQACGVPAAWFWRPRADDQRLRCPRPMHGPDDLARWARSLSPRLAAAASYANAARSAALRIAELL